MSDTSPETPATSEPSAPPITAPGASAAVPQEQLDRAVALLLHAMQIRNYVELHRGRLPAELVRRWDAWYRGLAEVFSELRPTRSRSVRSWRSSPPTRPSWLAIVTRSRRTAARRRGLRASGVACSRLCSSAAPASRSGW